MVPLSAHSACGVAALSCTQSVWDPVALRPPLASLGSAASSIHYGAFPTPHPHIWSYKPCFREG